MLKRHSSEQITRENAGGSDDNGSWPVASGPPKATAAQLANRRYVLAPCVTGSPSPYNRHGLMKTQQQQRKSRS